MTVITMTVASTIVILKKAPKSMEKAIDETIDDGCLKIFSSPTFRYFADTQKNTALSHVYT